MSISNIIKDILKEKGMTQTELANLLGSTRQNFNNKMSRDNFTIKEIKLIAEVLDLKLIIINTENKKEYVIEYSGQTN